MGSFDGAEVCELVELYLLDILRKDFGENKIGFYRDDELSCFRNISGPESPKIEKKICKIFKQHGLNITVVCNLRIKEFLDVTFDLQTGMYYPCRKAYPKSIIKLIPAMISKRISIISSEKSVLINLPLTTIMDLKTVGFNKNIKSIPQPLERRKRSRNIFWLNQSFNSNVKRNIDK